MSVTASQYIKNSKRGEVFTGVFHYTRPVRSKHDKAVELYGLLSVSSEVEIPGQNIAKFAWDGLIDGFEYSKVDSTNEALKIALTEATLRIKQLIANDKNIADHGVDVNISVFVSIGNSLYVGLLGESDIYIYKNGKIVDISEMLGKKNAKTAALVVSESDVLFSSTKGFLKKEMSTLIGFKNSEELVESLDGIATNLLDSEGLLFFLTEGVESAVKEEVVEESVEEEVLPKVEEISLPKEQVPVKSKLDIDLRTAILEFLKKIPNLFKWVVPLRSYLAKVFGKVSEMFARFFTVRLFSLKESFGKKRWFKKFSARVSQSEIKIGKKREFKGFQVDGYKAKNKKIERFKIAAIVVLCIVLLVAGIKFTIDQKEAREISRSANEIFVKVEDFVKEAEEKSRTDKAAAETLVFRASEELKKTPEQLSEKDALKYSELEGKVLGIQDALYKRVGLFDGDGSIDTYLDTRLALGENSDPKDIAVYNDDRNNEYLLIADAGLKGVYRISLYDKEVKRLPDENSVLKEPVHIYIGKKGVYVLDSQVGVVRANFDENGWFESFTTLTGLGIENIGADEIAEFAVFTDSDNVYVLDRGEGVLLKSSNFGSGYGLSYGYIKEDSFSGANDVLADLSVYILTSGPEGLHRYIYSYTESKQVPANLEILGIDGEFKNLSYGYTRGELNYDLYLFDSEDLRVFRFEKPIESGADMRHPNQVLLKNQYVYRGSRENIWRDVNDFVVDRGEKFLYMLDSSTVWKIRL